jgi:DNA-binding NarL/FixJ family response regulator
VRQAAPEKASGKNAAFRLDPEGEFWLPVLHEASRGFHSVTENKRIENEMRDLTGCLIRTRADDDDRRLATRAGRAAPSAPRRPRLLLADDHLLVAEALKSLLSAEFELVGVVADGRALIEAAGTLRPDVIVSDVSMPLLNGIDALIQLRQAGDRVPVVLLTMHREVAVARRALAAGASGFVLKHSAPVELVVAIRAALEGRGCLSASLATELQAGRKAGLECCGDPLAAVTPRQREVLQLLAEGHPAKVIGARLEISARTVEFHKYQLMETLSLHTSAELIHFAIRHGLVAL